MLPHLIAQNWLLSYQTIEGIENILERMDNRMKRNSTIAVFRCGTEDFLLRIQTGIHPFFEELRADSEQKIQTL